jgi:hypothetical protein
VYCHHKNNTNSISNHMKTNGEVVNLKNYMGKYSSLKHCISGQSYKGILPRIFSDPELDLGTKMGLGRPKNQSAQNGFKTDMCVGLVDTSRYHGLFIWPNKQNKMMVV